MSEKFPIKLKGGYHMLIIRPDLSEWIYPSESYEKIKFVYCLKTENNKNLKKQ